MPVCGIYIYIYCAFITRRVHARMRYIYILCVHNPESAWTILRTQLLKKKEMVFLERVARLVNDE